MSYKTVIDRIPDEVFDWGEEPAMILRDNANRRWFLAPDISRALGYYKYKRAIKYHLTEQDMERYGKIKNTITTKVSARVRDDWRFLSEKGVVKLIGLSKKPYAKQLRSEYFD